MKKLSILIASIEQRKLEFEVLMQELNFQVHSLEDGSLVEIIFDIDNKQKSIGKKRQDLLNRSTGEYIVFIDDDDMPSPFYIRDVLHCIKAEPDCIGIKILMTTNGAHPQICCHRLKYKEWQEKVDGFDYVRNVTHFNPVKRSLAIACGGFKDLRFAEDKDYADRLTKICKSEVFFYEYPLLNYRYSNTIPNEIKFGLRNEYNKAF